MPWQDPGAGGGRYMFGILSNLSPHLANDTGDSTSGTFRNHPLLPNNKIYLKNHEIVYGIGRFGAFGAT